MSELLNDEHFVIGDQASLPEGDGIQMVNYSKWPCITLVSTDKITGRRTSIACVQWASGIASRPNQCSTLLIPNNAQTKHLVGNNDAYVAFARDNSEVDIVITNLVFEPGKRLDESIKIDLLAPTSDGVTTPMDVTDYHDLQGNSIGPGINSVNEIRSLKSYVVKTDQRSRGVNNQQARLMISAAKDLSTPSGTMSMDEESRAGDKPKRLGQSEFFVTVTPQAGGEAARLMSTDSHTLEWVADRFIVTTQLWENRGGAYPSSVASDADPWRPIFGGGATRGEYLSANSTTRQARIVSNGESSSQGPIRPVFGVSGQAASRGRFRGNAAMVRSWYIAQGYTITSNSITNVPRSSSSDDRQALSPVAIEGSLDDDDDSDDDDDITYYYDNGGRSMDGIASKVAQAKSITDSSKHSDEPVTRSMSPNTQSRTAASVSAQASNTNQLPCKMLVSNVTADTSNMLGVTSYQTGRQYVHALRTAPFSVRLGVAPPNMIISNYVPSNIEELLDAWKQFIPDLAIKEMNESIFLEHQLKSKGGISRLREQVETGETKIYQAAECAICMEQECDAVLLHCMHACMHKQCLEAYQNQTGARSAKLCPLCRSPIQGALTGVKLPPVAADVAAADTNMIVV